MDEKNPQEPKLCGCRCGCLLSTDHLRGVKYVTVEGKPVLINMTCSVAAYGDEADVVDRILALLSLDDPEFERKLRLTDKNELEEQLLVLERLSIKAKELTAAHRKDKEIVSCVEKRDEILSRMKDALSKFSRS